MFAGKSSTSVYAVHGLWPPLWHCKSSVFTRCLADLYFRW